MDPQHVRAIYDRIREEVGKVVVGHQAALNRLLVGLLCRGHLLLHGVPGTAKTLLARAFAACFSLEFRRIQFTPDLMPGDILGTNLFDFRSGEFRLTKGPIFTELLLADEINRTPPKTQAALLEAMQERAVTLEGTTYPLGEGFIVIATQNPLEQEGTYPLPEAQLDRFLLKIAIGYPKREDEQIIVGRHGAGVASPDFDTFDVQAVCTLEEILEARQIVADTQMNDDVRDYVVDLVRATRDRPELAAGASPRAAAMLASTARAVATLRSRDFVTPDDVKPLAVSALAHRVVLSPSSEIEGITAETVIERILDEVKPPR